MSKTPCIRVAGETGVNHAYPRMIYDRGASIQRSNGARGRDLLTYGRECGAGSRGFKGNGASLKARRGARTAIGQAGLGDGEGARIVRVSEHQSRAA